MEEFWGLRREGGGKIAGVCAALATRWQVDPLVVRIGAVLLGLSAGLGVVLYLFAWALLPTERDPESPVQRHAPRLAQQSREFWVVTAVVSAVVVAVSLGQLAPLGISPALVVLAVWYFGFRRPQQRARRESGPTRSQLLAHDPFSGPDTPFTTAARQWQQTVLQHRAASGPPPTSTPTTAPATSPTTSEATARWSPVPGPGDPDPVRPEVPGPPWADAVPGPGPGRGSASEEQPATTAAPRSAEALSDHTAAVRSYLNVADPAGLYTPPPGERGERRRGDGRTTAVAYLVLTLVALGAVTVLDVLTPLPVTPAGYLGTALLVAALMLVVAAFRGRFRGQVVIALVLLAATAVTAVPATAARSTSWQQTTWQQTTRSYSSLSELPAEDSVDVGVLRADLSGLEVTEDADYRLGVDAGRIELVLPPGTRVELTTTVDVGSVSVAGQRSSGVDLTQRHELGPPGGAVLTVDARVDAGTVEVSTR